MIKPIKTEEQYEEALERVYHLLQTEPQPQTEKGDELELLVTLIESYEAIHYPMSASDPVAYLKNKMAQNGLKQIDLIPFIGDKAMVSKVLNKKRELTLSMIKRLSKGLNIPATRLIGH
ncbi:HTH-type transcriptional regulator/antitoxin HigA [Runella defluvii]|uniref:HTH-type transcriptional regulator/antitoxin HigA n=1 Tax=Runella defluvii TaxID=370973 RepID=A0A7W6EP54_9BACT|nr:transcriptional regulator [Runella defluvii]MBB3837118.1 HTH-type transcriptional regulator/antitoxin HigA [Runella defluvii]HAK80413.1 transcriptional regulator [Runella sp.]HAO49903.1 transcriptional regulator [Runella sp.]